MLRRHCPEPRDASDRRYGWRTRWRDASNPACNGSTASDDTAMTLRLPLRWVEGPKTPPSAGGFADLPPPAS